MQGPWKKIVVGALALSVSGIALAGPKDDPGVDRRQQRQERRLQKGENSGQLTPEEARKLEAEQDRLAKEEDKMKADGKLTKGERKKLHHDQNKASREIRRLKHNQ